MAGQDEEPEAVLGDKTLVAGNFDLLKRNLKAENWWCVKNG
jgi:hypothetical protein